MNGDQSSEQRGTVEQVWDEAHQWHKTIKDAIASAEKFALIDSLTGLYNRRFYNEEIKKAVTSAERGQPLSLILLDIDYFKHKNDRFGHLVGDKVLQQLGNLIRKNIRGADIACRYGGDEAIIILPQTRLRDEQDKENGAAKIAERLRSEVEKKLRVENQPATVSIGVTEWRKGDNPETLFKRVDVAMYRAKEAGRNQVKAAD